MIPKNSYQAERELILPTKHTGSMPSYIKGLYDGWEEGQNDMKSWLFSPCTEHLTEGRIVFEHRHQCPECMKELEGQ